MFKRSLSFSVVIFVLLCPASGLAQLSDEIDTAESLILQCDSDFRLLCRQRAFELFAEEEMQCSLRTLEASQLYSSLVLAEEAFQRCVAQNGYSSPACADELATLESATQAWLGYLKAHAEEPGSVTECRNRALERLRERIRKCEQAYCVEFHL